ncbi:uncharacterized protein LOC135216059 isoform X1 [Macrobrachium nipponense]|uniref:uncharacterized protein LOC135216059 isoform X1 n=1 Tax=Macrobrachium nipponense TaxID=159736 RepID=UPI0030C7C34A
MTSSTLVLAMLVLAVSGKSIDNPAENPDRPAGMEMAVPTVVETVKRDGKSLALPPPVQVTSGVITVLGDARKGRVIEIGDDGIPIIHGVREPDDPSDTKVYRNARIINNKLITPEDELRMNGIKGRALSTHSNERAGHDRTARILTEDSSASGRAVSGSGSGSGSGSWIFRDNPTREGVIAPVPSRGHSTSAAGSRGARKYPAFYYRKYYNNERVGVIAESSFEDDSLSTSSEKVVSYSYLAAPNGNSRSDTSRGSSSNDVVYGTGSAAKPPSQGASAGVSLHTVEAPSLVTAESVSVPVQHQPVLVQRQDAPVQHQSFEPSLNVIGVSASNDVATSLSNPVPFGPASNPSESFAVHQVPLHEHGHSQFHHLPITPPPHAPPTVFQADHSNFIIKDTTFQAHPGAPTFTIPIPIPTQQAQSIRRRPFHRNNIKASSEVVEHALSATGDLSYTSYDPYDIVQEPSTKKPIYKKMIEPFMKAGEKLYEMASPVLDPMFNVGSRISHSLGIQSDSEPFSLLSMNDYISRTVDGGGVPVVAGVAALTAIAIGAIAVASSTNVTIGKRSLGDPVEDFMYQMLDPYPTREPTLLDRLEQYTSWTESKCSKRIFCDVMTYVGDDYLYNVEKRLDMFLRVLNRGSAEESALKKTANDVMSAVRSHNCGVFSCGGSGVDASQVSHSSSGPR